MTRVRETIQETKINRDDDARGTGTARTWSKLGEIILARARLFKLMSK